MVNKQTAVEWLVEEIEKHYIVNNAELNPAIVMQLKRQAKQMEKEEIIDAHIEGHNAPSSTLKHHDAEQYYNETYGKE